MNLEFFGNLGHRLKLARRLPPRLVLAKIAKRLPWVEPRSARIAEIVHSANELRPDRLIGYFRSQEAVLSDALGLPPFEFDGRRLLEIGPGPLAGWGPMALFRGARSVHAVDPDWIDGVFDDAAVERAYLRAHHAALAATFGPRMDYEAFRTCIRERLEVWRAGLAGLRLSEPVDLVLSNSCLEHIHDLGEALETLADLMAPRARFMHLVNFGNHRDRASPFGKIYEMSPEVYRRRFGRHINLLRPSDVADAFARAGIEARMIAVDRRPDRLDAVRIDPWWQQRYAREDLEIRTALFVGPLDRSPDGGGVSSP